MTGCSLQSHVRTLSNAVEHARGCVAINIGRLDMVVIFTWLIL